jgi:hypothetical protein
MRFGEEFHWVKKNKGKGPVASSDVLADGNRTTVQAAIDSATSGATIKIPSGTWTWDGGVTLDGSKIINLIGAVDNTVTIVNTASAGSSLIHITESSLGHMRVGQLTFDSSTVNHAGDAGTHHIHVNNNPSGGRAVLIHDTDHLLGDGWNYKGVDGIHIHTNRGVLYRNSFNASFIAPQYINGIAAFRHKLLEGPYGLGQWESASTMGTLDVSGESNLYVEDCTFNGLAQCTDIDDSCRLVFRYNTCMDALVLSHGFDSSPYGCRQVELYNNTLDYGGNTVEDPTLGPVPMNVSSLIGMRGGGVWYIYNNQVADPSTPGGLWGGRNALLMELYTLRGNPYCETGSYPIYHQHGRGHNGTSYILDPIRIWGNTKLGTPWVTTGIGDPMFTATSGSHLYVHATDSCRGDGLTTADFVQVNRDFYLSDPGTYTAKAYPHPLRHDL